MVANTETNKESSKPARPSIAENITQLDILHFRESSKHFPTFYYEYC